jgi:hypothetical protein
VTRPPNILSLRSHDTGRAIQPYGHHVPTPNVPAPPGAVLDDPDQRSAAEAPALEPEGSPR